ncbi:MAG: hypothetical protein SPE81_06020 [Agathobacter sp.]|nr:hypothetical protein [Agathobacter sp.]
MRYIIAMVIADFIFVLSIVAIMCLKMLVRKKSSSALIFYAIYAFKVIAVLAEVSLGIMIFLLLAFLINPDVYYAPFIITFLYG